MADKLFFIFYTVLFMAMLTYIGAFIFKTIGVVVVLIALWQIGDKLERKVKANRRNKRKLKK